MNRHPLSLKLVWLVGSAMLVSAGCSRQQAAGPPPNPVVPVTVAQVLQKPVPITLRAIGNVEAYSTVSIKAQVSAQLMEVHFQQGEFVKKGDLLFTLDERPFQAALAQAQGNLARDQAQAEIAEVQAQRYAKLFHEGVAAKEQYDQFKATANATEAAVRADQAAVEAAKLEVQYCFIYSPIDGRTGTLMVNVGNLVKANDVPILIVINQVNPIYVEFAVPEQYLAEVKRYMAASTLPVEVYLADDSQHPEVGKLTFVDNSVDTTTGTIKLKGTFSNPNRRLWPGQFVNTALRLAEQENAIVVPAQTVQTGQNGQYVFVVKPDKSVEMRTVTTGRSQNGETVIVSGLRPGETVVTDGQLNLVPGSKVEIKSGSAGS
jgi:multidrug efflux system membrane fusion protein